MVVSAPEAEGVNAQVFILARSRRSCHEASILVGIIADATLLAFPRDELQIAVASPLRARVAASCA